MSTYDKSNVQVLHVRSGVRKFRTVVDLGDYLGIKSRIQRSTADGATRKQHGSILQRWHSFSRGDRLGIIIAVGTIIGVMIAAATLAVIIL
jgi:hypothetical protein